MLLTLPINANYRTFYISAIASSEAETPTGSGRIQREMTSLSSHVVIQHEMTSLSSHDGELYLSTSAWRQRFENTFTYIVRWRVLLRRDLVIIIITTVMFPVAERHFKNIWVHFWKKFSESESRSRELFGLAHNRNSHETTYNEFQSPNCFWTPPLLPPLLPPLFLSVLFDVLIVSLWCYNICTFVSPVYL